MELVLCEGKQEAEGIAIRSNGVGTRAPLLNEAFHEERLQQRRKRSHRHFHGFPPVSRRSNRLVANCSNSGTASRYQYVSFTWVWPRYVASLGISRSTSRPTRYQLIKVWTAKRCRRSCSRGPLPRRLPGGRKPILREVCKKAHSTILSVI